MAEQRRSVQRVHRVRRRPHRTWHSYLPRLRDSRSIATGIAVGGIAFVLLIITAAVSVYVYFLGSYRIFPGVTVTGEAVGGKTMQEAARLIESAWAGNPPAVTVSNGERVWQASASEFGFVIDADATAQRALQVGRGAGLISGIVQLYQSAVRGTAVTPVVVLEEETARAGLEAWAALLNMPPQDATLRFENGQAVAVPGVPGQALNIEATLAALSIDPGAVLHAASSPGGSLPLVIVPIQPRITDASDALAEAAPLLDAPLDIVAYDPITDEDLTWTATPDEIALWLQVEQADDGLHVTVSEERLAAYLAELDAGLGGGRSIDPQASVSPVLEALIADSPAVLTITYPPTTYTVQAGDTLTRIAWNTGMPLWRIMQANPGLNPDALTIGQTITIPPKTDLLPLPVIPGKRIVVSISEQRLRVYENRQLIREFVISTGIDRSPTQPGVFQVQTHELSAYASVWDLTMPHFLGIYEAWPGFMNGFHGLPTLSSGNILWADVLGRPASFGCIILDLDDAEWLYDWAEDGVVVEIVE